ncbi:NAD-dependent epimerase/dehydratase family protein [Falsiroseomonas sp.]|uniref:NAD-dependent epimerase/dehydratase family protein n=1 Tax=Falsiroseomonas sp. TaxID=2870721 RepID=UPI00271865AB|nr:NAD-dependent epimerase/dehydratase family protein [Falsiroseomonas sp.]MDO9498741.1 SDR family NAD(P)-dependent oxidoreductase [Falsiroseomonas sp.]
MTLRMVVAGLGYSGAAIAVEAAAKGFAVTGTARDPSRAAAVPLVGFAEAGEAIRAATHLIVTAGPEEAGCPVLLAHAAAIAGAPGLRWIGYLSTTGVYGDRGGAEVDEATPPAPGQPRSAHRLRVEEAWRAVAAARGAALDLFRVGGIYGPGPGRSALEDVRRGTARRVVKPGHSFSRIHRDDIALAVVAAARQDHAGTRVLHLVDDEPAPNADVVAEAARLLGVAPPPEIPFEQASVAMSPMGRSFWAENRRVANAATKAALGIAWRYPTYREGLAQILKG